MKDTPVDHVTTIHSADPQSTHKAHCECGWVSKSYPSWEGADYAGYIHHRPYLQPIEVDPPPMPHGITYNTTSREIPAAFCKCGWFMFGETFEAVGPKAQSHMKENHENS